MRDTESAVQLMETALNRAVPAIVDEVRNKAIQYVLSDVDDFAREAVRRVVVAEVVGEVIKEVRANLTVEVNHV